MDKISPERRSANMAAIKAKNTRPEIVVRRLLHEKGVRYRTHVRDLPGKPDIAIKKFKLALEVRGCFWHGHEGCSDFRLPKTNVEFWGTKINATVLRDAGNEEKLKALGYSVFVIWECDLKRDASSAVMPFLKEYWLRKDIAER